MLKKIIGTFFLLYTLMIPLSASGQDVPSGKWWRDAQIVKALNLTDAQISNLDKAYFNSRKKLIKLKSEVETEQLELQNRFDRKPLDEKSVQAQHQKMESARKKLSDERFRYIMTVRKIIGYEKYNQLKNFSKGRRGDAKKNKRR